MKHWRRSGLTIRDFCSQHRLSEPSFYSWRRLLSERDREKTKPAVARRPGKDAANTRPAFVPIRIVSAPPATIEVLLGNGRVLRVPAGFDAATLRQLLAVMEELSC